MAKRKQARRLLRSVGSHEPHKGWTKVRVNARAGATYDGYAKRKIVLSCSRPMPAPQRLQTLLLGLTYNLYRLWHATFCFRMSTEPGQIFVCCLT